MSKWLGILPGSVELDYRDPLFDGVLEALAGQLKNADLFDFGGVVLRLLTEPGAQLLFDERLERVQRTGAAVLLDLLAVDDPQQRRVSLHVEVLANRAVLCAVDARNGHRRIVFQRVGQVVPRRLEALTRETEC